ncbi:MAG: hypothetical protein RRY22_04965 [Bacilli bacterium]
MNNTILNNKADTNYSVNGVNLVTTSNISTFTIQNQILTASKTNLPVAGSVGTVVSFTIQIKNNDATQSATSVVLTDNLTAAGYTYVTGTAKVNGVAVAQTPNAGIPVGTILAGATSIVTFNATVN